MNPPLDLVPTVRPFTAVRGSFARQKFNTHRSTSMQVVARGTLLYGGNKTGNDVMQGMIAVRKFLYGVRWVEHD